MLKLDERQKQHLSLFTEPQTFCALRFTCRSFRAALSVEHECYYFARVKYISSFRLKPNIVGLSNYRDIFERIVSLRAMDDSFYPTVSACVDYIELVFKTPVLLEKLSNLDGGPSKIISFLITYPSFHGYLFENSLLVRQFAETDEYWASSFIYLIYSDAQIYDSLLDCDEMMLALAAACRPESNDHFTLCDYLDKRYHAEKEKIDAVTNLKAPRIDVELQTQERKEAIYSLLKSLKPVGAKSNLL